MLVKRIAALVVVLAMAGSACTLSQGKDYRVDVVTFGLYVHMKPGASHLVWGVLAPLLGWNGPVIGRYLRDNIGPNGGISEAYWDRAAMSENGWDVTYAAFLTYWTTNRDCLRFWHSWFNSVDWINERC